MSGKQYPIILGGGSLRKGLMVLRGQKMKGYDLYICWLKREIPSGERFEVDDIEKVQSVLHFCDRKAVEVTVSALNEMLKMWKDEKNEVYD